MNPIGATHASQSLGHASPALKSGTCWMDQRSPWPAAFLPQPPPKVALLCSAGSLVVRRSPTPPPRACPPYGIAPSRTGLPTSQARRRSPGSRACCFLSVRGVSDYAGFRRHSRVAHRRMWPSPYVHKVGIPERSFRSSIPGPPMPLSTLRLPPRGDRRKTRGQDGVASPFL